MFNGMKTGRLILNELRRTFVCKNTLCSACLIRQPPFTFTYESRWKRFPRSLVDKTMQESLTRPSYATTLHISSRSFAAKPVVDGLEMSMQNPRIRKYLQNLAARFESARKVISENSSRHYDQEQHIETLNALEPLVGLYFEYMRVEGDLKELRKFILDAHECNDKEMVDIAKQDEESMLCELNELERNLLQSLIPVDISSTDVILEIGAGVGGQEAMLFASELFEAYTNYAYGLGWDFQLVNEERGEKGGLRHAVASVSGDDAYQLLRFEGGVHRVQRVPVTERSGRMHTSTVTVIVMPQPNEIELKIDTKDLKIQTMKASGAGGQHVNKTESAVRIVHIPTGISAECQAERSQIKNKEIAMISLRSRLFQIKLDERAKANKRLRKLQVASVDRASKIRTYNFSHDRITDHRIGLTTYGLNDFMNGGTKMDTVLSTTQEHFQYLQLKEIITEFEEETEIQQNSK